MAFKAIVKATAGLLLGGVKVHESAPFLQKSNAAAWLAQCVHANNEAGRHGYGRVIEVKAARRRCADAYDETPEAERLRLRMADAEKHLRRYGL